MDATHFGWLSQLQKRADYARKSALAARTASIAKELAELAALYDGVAGRAEAEAGGALTDQRRVPPPADRDGLVRHLMSRSYELLSEARHLGDLKRADELKHLAGVYGAEAARLKTGL